MKAQLHVVGLRDGNFVLSFKLPLRFALKIMNFLVETAYGTGTRATSRPPRIRLKKVCGFRMV